MRVVVYWNVLRRVCVCVSVCLCVDVCRQALACVRSLSCGAADTDLWRDSFLSARNEMRGCLCNHERLSAS